MTQHQPRRFNTQSSLTYVELSGIILDLEAEYKEQMINTNADDIGPYKLMRGKVLALRELLYKFEDHMTNRHKDQTNEFGDDDNFD